MISDDAYCTCNSFYGHLVKTASNDNGTIYTDFIYGDNFYSANDSLMEDNIQQILNTEVSTMWSDTLLTLMAYISFDTKF